MKAALSRQRHEDFSPTVLAVAVPRGGSSSPSPPGSLCQKKKMLLEIHQQNLLHQEGPAGWHAGTWGHPTAAGGKLTAKMLPQSTEKSANPNWQITFKGVICLFIYFF